MARIPEVEDYTYTGSSVSGTSQSKTSWLEKGASYASAFFDWLFQTTERGLTLYEKYKRAQQVESYSGAGPGQIVIAGQQIDTRILIYGFLGIAGLFILINLFRK
jgi:hypothetical protein